MALSGSTNAMIHLVAMAGRAEGAADLYHRTGRLEPDLRIAGRLVFLEETLDAFKRTQ